MSTGTILYIEDNLDNRTLIRRVLMAEGYNVLEAGYAGEALELLKTEHPDLILMDINMPDMDGFTLMAEIKTRYPDIPIILITGFSATEAKKIAFEKGANAFVAKPFRLKDLKRVIESVSSQ